jgi:hypothetical protein
VHVCACHPLGTALTAGQSNFNVLHTLSGTSGGSSCRVLRCTLMLSVLLALSQLLLTVNVGGALLLSQGSRPDRLVPGLAAASEACSASHVTDCRQHT